MQTQHGQKKLHDKKMVVDDYLIVQHTEVAFFDEPILSQKAEKEKKCTFKMRKFSPLTLSL